MKLAKLVDPRFQETLKKLSGEKLPLKTAFKLKGIINKTTEEFTKYDELRIESLRKYSKKDENGEMILDVNGNAELDPAGAAEFVRELGELTSLELEIQEIKISELGDSLSMTADDLLFLDGIIVDG